MARIYISETGISQGDIVRALQNLNSALYGVNSADYMDMASVGASGVPVMFGGLNSTQAFYFVDGGFGDDTNYDGLSKTYPFATIAEAITVARAKVDWAATPWAVRDVIVIAPGTYVENLTNLAHGTIMIGLGWDNRDGQMGVKICPSAGSPVTVGGIVNSAFIGMGFESVTTGIPFNGGVVNNCLFTGCRFSGPAETVTAVAAFKTTDCVRTKWINCEFSCAALGLEATYTDGGDSFSHNRVVDCTFDQITTAGIRTHVNLVGPSSLVKNCTLVGGGQTMAIGIDDNAGILDVSRCDITATDPIQGCRSANGCYGNGTLLGGSGE